MVYKKPRTTDIQIQIPIPIPNTYLGCGYNGLVLCRNNGKHGQKNHCTKMGADSLAENTPNVPEFICPIGLLKPKISGFQCKKGFIGRP